MNSAEEKASLTFWALTQKADLKNKDKFWTNNFYIPKMLEGEQ